MPLFETHAHHLGHLVEVGTHARADILESHETSSTDLGYTSDYVKHPRAGWEHKKLVVMVHPDDGDRFKATIRTKWFPMAGFLIDGEQVQVWYDPADEHRECLIDYEGALGKWEMDNLEQLRQKQDVTEDEYAKRRAEIIERCNEAGSPVFTPKEFDAQKRKLLGE